MALKILDSSGLKHLLSKIKSLLSGKADKSTTLSGYGITNAYTKTETDTAINNAKYTLPNATSSVLGGVKVGTNISVSSGTISVANGSTSAKGVVQLTNSTSSTSTTTAATPNSVKSAYDLANSKQSPATTLSGYGITDAYTKTEVDTAVNGAKYTLPNATSSTLGGVKVGSNITVSSGTISLSKTNVTNALGYTPPTTNTTYSNATTSTAGLMSTTDKAKLDGIASGANAYTLPTASSSTLGGVKTTSTVTSTSGLTACPIISGVPYYKDTNTTYTLSSFGVTATSAELNVMDGITATTTELNYCDGVTSNIQTQLNGKSDSGHKHSSEYLSWNRGSLDVDKQVNGGMYLISQGTNCPSGSQYGVVLTMPYRGLTGNSTPDFGAQLFIPNGDDNTKPNAMFYRTGLKETWNEWQEVATMSALNALAQRVATLEANSVGKLATVATTGSYKDLIDLPTKLNEIKDY